MSYDRDGTSAVFHSEILEQLCHSQIFRLIGLDLIILLSYCANAHLKCIILVCDESGLYCFVILNPVKFAINTRHASYKLLE